MDVVHQPNLNPPNKEAGAGELEHEKSWHLSQMCLNCPEVHPTSPLSTVHTGTVFHALYLLCTYVIPPSVESSEAGPRSSLVRLSARLGEDFLAPEARFEVAEPSRSREGSSVDEQVLMTGEAFTLVWSLYRFRLAGVAVTERWKRMSVIQPDRRSTVYLSVIKYNYTFRHAHLEADRATGNAHLAAPPCLRPFGFKNSAVDGP